MECCLFSTHMVAPCLLTVLYRVRSKIRHGFEGGFGTPREWYVVDVRHSNRPRKVRVGVPYSCRRAVKPRLIRLTGPAAAEAECTRAWAPDKHFSVLYCSIDGWLRC